MGTFKALHNNPYTSSRLHASLYMLTGTTRMGEDLHLHVQVDKKKKLLLVIKPTIKNLKDK